MVGVRRRDDLEARDVDEVALRALAVLSAAQRRADGRAHHHRHRQLPARHVAQLRRLVDELVHALEQEVGVLHVGDRAHPEHGRADRRAAIAFSLIGVSMIRSWPNSSTSRGRRRRRRRSRPRCRCPRRSGRRRRRGASPRRSPRAAPRRSSAAARRLRHRRPRGLAGSGNGRGARELDRVVELGLTSASTCSTVVRHQRAADERSDRARPTPPPRRGCGSRARRFGCGR